MHVPVNYNLIGEELAYLVTQPGSAALFMDPAFARTVDDVAHQLDAVRRGTLRDGDGGEDLVQLLYTSGTTSAPKGTMTSHTAMVHEYLSAAHSLELSGLRKAQYGASIMPAPVLAGLREALPGIGFYNAFGQSEIGVPDERWIEAITAYVVTSAELTSAELIETTSGHLSGFKLPKNVVFVEDLPRNASGKLLKRELRDDYANRPAR